MNAPVQQRASTYIGMRPESPCFVVPVVLYLRVLCNLAITVFHVVYLLFSHQYT